MGETMFNREPHRNILTFVPTDFLVRSYVVLARRTVADF